MTARVRGTRKSQGADREEERALLERLSRGLSEEEIQRVLACAILALDERGRERLVARLGEETSGTLGRLLVSRGRSRTAAEPSPGSAKIHEEWGKAWDALGMRILKAKKGEYYEAALSHFENAKRCYERSDLHREWAALVADVCRAHHRKVGFLAGFERLAAGQGPSDAPSFLDRARHRWSARAEPTGCGHSGRVKRALR